MRVALETTSVCVLFIGVLLQTSEELKCLSCDGWYDPSCNEQPYKVNKSHEIDCDAPSCFSHRFTITNGSIVWRTCGIETYTDHPAFETKASVGSYGCNFDLCNYRVIVSGDVDTYYKVPTSGAQLNMPWKTKHFILAVLLHRMLQHALY